MSAPQQAVRPKWDEKLYRQQYYQRHKERLLASNKAYRLAHPDQRVYADRRLNKRLRITNTYSRIKARCEGRGTPRSRHIYYGLSFCSQSEFVAWAESDTQFHKLFDAWAVSGFSPKLGPSIDRIENSEGYTLQNMRWITLSANSQRVWEEFRKSGNPPWSRRKGATRRGN